MIITHVVPISETVTANWEDCKPTVGGVCYNGTTSTTSSGRTCQRWDTQTPHEHKLINSNRFPERTLAEVANYCRNPDGENTVWCYTTDDDKRWEICDIPVCSTTGNHCRSLYGSNM